MLLNFQCCVQAVSYMRMYDQGDNLGLKSTSSSACQVMCSGAGQCREPVWGTLPMAKVMRKEASAYAKADQASGNSLFPSIYSQNQSLPTLLFHPNETVPLTYTSDFTGGWLPLCLSEKELTYSSKSIKIPGHDKSVSTYELLWSLFSLPVQVRPATCDCLQPPNRERHEMF